MATKSLRGQKFALGCKAVAIEICMDIWHVFIVLTSPLWYFFWLICEPDTAADFMLTKRDENGSDIKALRNIHHNFAIGVVMHDLWKPVIWLMPMSIRREFISRDTKPLRKYSVKTQVKYYFSQYMEDRVALLKSGKLSEEAMDEIWMYFTSPRFETPERERFLEAGVQLTSQQVKDLVIDNKGHLLKDYFAKYTPNVDVIRFLVSHTGGAGVEQALLNIVRRQRPTPEVLKILMMSPRSDLRDKINLIMEDYLDVDAVQETLDAIDKAENDQEINAALERWRKYCSNRSGMSVGAQKKMTFKLFEIFKEQGCHLTPNGLSALCARLKREDEKFLRSVLRHEFQITGCIIATLLNEYWKYSVYLEVKKELKN